MFFISLTEQQIYYATNEVLIYIKIYTYSIMGEPTPLLYFTIGARDFFITFLTTHIIQIYEQLIKHRISSIMMMVRCAVYYGHRRRRDYLL